ncbi:MAG: hypothetical protein ACK5MP_09070 [Nostocoides sp.]
MAHQPWDGHGITTLFPYAGKVYLGYGSYTTNSGTASGLGCDVSAYDPVAGSFVVAMPGVATEAILTYRQIGGRLYVPQTDPTFRPGDPRCGSFASNASGTWRAGGPAADGQHYYDVQAGAPGELILAGGGGSAGRIWSSTDGGSTWTQLINETDTIPDGFERFFWIGRIGSVLYVKAALGQYSQDSPMRTFDVKRRRWGTVNSRSIDTGYVTPYGPYLLGEDPAFAGSKVISSDGYIYVDTTYAGLVAFNGRSMAYPLGRGVSSALIPSDDGAVYAATSAGTFRLSGTGATRLDGESRRPGDALAVLGGRLYAGTTTGEVLSRPLA